ncbi:MAG: hypothetical protein WCD79_16780, partial [Chthoniobacteraceae bacterium]
MKRLIFPCLLLISLNLRAQVPDPAPAPAAPAAGGGAAQPAAKPQSSFLGKDVPVFDPGSEIMTWDGKSWNVNDNRL